MQLPQVDFREWIKLLLIWRRKRLKDRQFVLLLALVIGFLSGLAAVIVKNTVHFIQYVLTESFISSYHYVLYFIYPIIGIYITLYFIRKVVKDKVNQGIPNVLYAISKKNGFIKKHNLYSSLVASAITVGFGGSAGLEGPAVGTTGAIASFLGRIFRLNYKVKLLLIGCAATGAMASLFEAPVAAIVFAIEVIMLDLTTASLIPLLIASASAAITSRLFLGDDVLVQMHVMDELRLVEIPFFMALGICTGFLSIYFSKIFFFISKAFDRIKSPMRRFLVGGVLLGLLLFLLPPLYGEGYNIMNSLIEGKTDALMSNSLFEGGQDNLLMVLLFLIAVLFFKAVATTLTFRAGGVGGVFAPAMFMGSIVGFVFSSLVNYSGLAKMSTSNFTLVGMAGMVGGVLHAPLTAIFLIAEITGGYELFIPLMITTSLSYLTTRYFLSHSIYTVQLARRGELITHDKDHAVLTLMKLNREIETNFLPVGPYDSLGDLVKTVSQSSRNLFPVVDKDGYFLGVVLLNDIRNIMFDRDLYEKTYVHTIMSDAPEHVSINENMESVMNKFEASGAWNLPVLKEGKYMGFVSKSKLFSAYRSQLRDFYEDTE